MSARAALTVLTLLMGCSPAPPAPGVVARVINRDILDSEIGLKTSSPPSKTCGPETPAGKLGLLVWEEVARHYLKASGLEATKGEIEELRAYGRKEDAKNVKILQKELREVEEGLAHADPTDEEHKRLEERRFLLLRLVRSAEPGTSQDTAPTEEFKRVLDDVESELDAFYASWIEIWKVNEAIYKQFGGAVDGTKFGPVASGARTALMREYAKKGLLKIFDKGLAQQFWESCDRPPKIIVPADRVDLRPFWKR